ncbi:MAG TPA: hypothetical protein VH170_06255 [Chthoniobacterales bacterium]|jgi:hypothetical protein|nr:hypothetical protein [Chthoniobacterales bacterium]
MNAVRIYLSVFVFALSACEKQSEIKVYRVSKAPLEEPESGAGPPMPANAPSPSMPGGMGAATATRDSSVPQIKWVKPETWTEVAPSSMRYASFSAGDGAEKIDISVISFAGEGGSDADNVNRWRQQLQLPSMSAAAIATQITPLQTESGAFATTDIAGPNARTLASWTRRDGRVWFFKATGPTAAIEKEKANFAKFIQSVRF